MSPTTSRQRLGRLFHRRDRSGASNDLPSDDPPSVPQSPTEGSHVRRKSSIQSIKNFVHNTGRSFSQHKDPQKRDTSANAYTQTRSGRSLSRTRKPRPGDISFKPPPVPQRQDALAGIPNNPQPGDLPDNLDALTLQESRDEQPRVLRRDARRVSQDDAAPVSTAPPEARPAAFKAIMTPFEPTADPYSENVADWNISQHGHHIFPTQNSSVARLPHSDSPVMGGLRDIPAPLKVKKSRSSELGSPASYAPPSQLAHKPNISDFRRSVGYYSEDGPVVPPQISSVPERRPVNRWSLQKPLPALPASNIAQPSETYDLSRENKHDSGTGNEATPDREYIIQDCKDPIDLKAHVDLSNTEETHMNVSWSPAVTHETRQVNTHEIVHRAVTREIHNHHVYHRILPVVDFEVLPARHFIPRDDGGLAEVSAADVPGGNTEQLQQLIAETVKKMMPKVEEHNGSSRFIPRGFEGVDGRYREYMTEDGSEHTEQWCVHEPTLRVEGKDTGQPYPYHLRSHELELNSMPKRGSMIAEPGRAVPMHTILPIQIFHAMEQT